MLGRESFEEYDDMLFEDLSFFYKNVLKMKFHKYNRVYGNIEVNTGRSNNRSMVFDEYNFDLIKNDKRGMFIKPVKFTDLYYKKASVKDCVDIGEYVYSVVLMGFNLEILNEKLEGDLGGGCDREYQVDENLFKDISEKFEFKESILSEVKEEERERIDDKKRERLKESERKWNSGIFSKYEFFMREEDMEYLLKGIFEDRVEKKRVRVWCGDKKVSDGDNEKVNDMDDGDDGNNGDDGDDGDDGNNVKINFFLEPLGIEKIERVKPCAYMKRMIFRLDERCCWAGQDEQDEKAKNEYKRNSLYDETEERVVLEFDREGFPLGG